MSFNQYIEAYLKQEFLKMKDPLHPTRVATLEDWERIPPEAKKMMMDLFLEMPLLKEVFRCYENKFPDQAFGNIIKAKIKEALK